jgi:hypothetical protein
MAAAKTSFSAEELRPKMEAKFKAVAIEGDVIENGHILIEANSSEWSSPVSAKTIAGIDLGYFTFPFKAGTILLGDKEISFSYKNGKLGVTYENDGGVFVLEVLANRPIGEDIANRGMSKKHEEMVYEVLSILLYIATFHSKAKVKTESLPMNQGSKRKSIPKHKIYLVEMKQEVEGHRRAGSTRKESDMSWLVRGHWRNQWYPKEGVNKPKWMNPYWKGKGKQEIEKVYKV